MKWVKAMNNEVLQSDGWYISYNPSTGGDILGELCTNLLNAFEQDVKDGEETALCSPDNEWYILEGDFRKEYEKAFPKGFEACKAVYDKHKEKSRSNWSTD